MIDSSGNVDRVRRIWNAFGSEESPNGRYFPLVSREWGRVMAGYDLETGREALQLTIAEELKLSASAMLKSEGFVSTALVETKGETVLRLVRSEQGDRAIFELICGDIWGYLERDERVTSGEFALHTWVKRLQEWQRFLRASQSGKMSLDQECGLIGELYVFMRLLEQKSSAERVLAAWRGPFQEVHDFTEDGRALEVKTSRGSSLGVYRIRSEKQLDPTGAAYLELGAIDLRGDADGRTLAEWIESVSRMLEVDEREEFQVRLFRVGVHPFKPEASGERWAVENARFFHVDDKFPSLSASNLPSAVYAVEYSLRLIHAVAYTKEPLFILKH